VTDEVAVLGVVAILLSALLTGVVRRLALSRGVLDVPNARSSHGKATPRGGGLAVVVGFSGLIGFLAYTRIVDARLAAALLGGGLPVALVGVADDYESVPVGWRLAVHFAVAAWAVVCLGAPITLGWGGRVFAVLAIVWAINLFNFMDGIDGIAGSESVFVAAAGGGLCAAVGGAVAVSAAAFVLAGSCLGFLLWNWPPARIFLGDVGSGFLGYCLAVLTLAAMRQSPAAGWTWSILMGVFLVDATVTLLRRAVSGARVHEAHRSHAYQYLARRWGSHLRVTLAVSALNLCWLLPLAFLASVRPRWAIESTVVALLPLAVIALWVGAGVEEARSVRTK
jgi:Fuc2NAc and GlcNAc transferase